MFSAGYNMPGYLPEMEPAFFFSYENARDFLIDELRTIEEEQAQRDDVNIPKLGRHYNELIDDVQGGRLPVYDKYTGYVFWIDTVEDIEDLEEVQA